VPLSELSGGLNSPLASPRKKSQANTHKSGADASAKADKSPRGGKVRCV